MFTRLREMWKLYENLLNCWGKGGVSGMWKEQVRLIHKIYKVRFLLYGEVVYSLDGIFTDCQFGSFCTIQEWSRLSYFFLFSAQCYVVLHSLVWYIQYLYLTMITWKFI